MSPSPTSSRGTPTRRGVGRGRGGTPRAGGGGTVSPSPAPTNPSTPKPSIPKDFFTSCLSIPVQGAKPIVRPNATTTQPSGASASTSSGSVTAVSAPAPAAPLTQASSAATMASSPGDSNNIRRAPRKSKTDAMAALANHNEREDEDDKRLRNPADGLAAIFGKDAEPIPTEPRLNLYSVKTRSPRLKSTQQKAASRPFGLEECPTYFPTPEEFTDPMAYIRRIGPEAREYGIAKIVPPEGWAMPFVTDTERFRFTTRLQKLNSIEASSRAKINFLEQLYRYHQQVGNTRVSVPTINNKPLDLWLLRKEVERMGGYLAVNKARKWTDVGRQLGYTGIPGLSTQLKNAYARVILPYEEFQRHVKASPALAHISTAARDPTLRTHAPPQASGSGSTSGAGASALAPESPLSDEESELSEMEVEDDKPASTSRSTRRSTRGSSLEQTTPSKKPASTAAPALPEKNATTRADRDRESDEDSGEQACEVCHSNDNGEEMLLCDGCDCGFHMFCLDPPLHTIPKGQWFCHTCLFGTGGDYGFDEGEEHTLTSFQARDAEFRKLWFTSHPPDKSKRDPHDAVAYKFGDVSVTENDVEREFWRLVEDPHDTVEIEYGADVHSTTHGSASPTMETHPRNPYAKDPWNLNNMSILPDSLLRYIKSDISGMTVPWIYVGMVFSTFCWHNEDHYTYSVNFMHWGETKTWYGIPGADAQKFEAAIKREAPDLFEAQPDLLFQLVTLMNPGRIREAGVRVYACNQRAGEFVVTFPKAYHAGFNQGLNFNEAVNFALPDWLDFGRECIQRYREHRKLPVFSHDELVMTITHHSQTIATALWLKDSLLEMTSRERANRAKARSLGLQEVLEHEDRPEDQYQCTICKVFCYLSQITCGCTNRVVCADHAEQLCSCATDQRALRLRFSDAELQATAAKVEERARAPVEWVGRLQALLHNTPRPPLNAMRALVSDGRRIPHPLEGLDALVAFVFEASRWVDSANAILERKPSVNGAAARPANIPTFAHVKNLMLKVGKLGFDAPEVAGLAKVAAQAEDMQKRAVELLAAVDRRVSTCEDLISEASMLNIAIPEVDRLANILQKEEVLSELRIEVEDNAMSLNEVSALLARAYTCGLTSENVDVRALERRQLEGQSWEDRARHVLQQPYKTIEELARFLDEETTSYIEPATQTRLTDALQRARKYESQAKAWRECQAYPHKPTLGEVEQLVTASQKEFSIAAVDEMKDLLNRAKGIENKCDEALNRRYKLTYLEDMFDVMQKWIDYGKQHLQMFSMPKFDELDKQLTLHARWVESLPWYPPIAASSMVAKQMFHDVIAATRPEDDLPHDDEGYSCICDEPVRAPPAGVPSDAVQCDHCDARFHGKCARSGGSCPFCDQRHWDGTHARLQDRPWHFCYMPMLLAQAPTISRHYAEQYRDLELMVHRLDRISSHIGQFLAFTSHPMNQRRDYLGYVRHFMRKLYTIRFTISPSTDVSFGLDLAGLHRLLARQPQTTRAKKRRRPKFTFGQDEDQDWADGTRCICRGLTSYLLHYPKVTCETCNRVYHADCVFYPKHLQQNLMRNELRFVCPLCCLRKNRPYEHAELRVRYTQPGQPIQPGPGEVFVDTGRMLDTFSKDLILIALPQPYKNTLYVELKHFTPGQPDFAPANDKPNGRKSHSATSPTATPLPPAPVAGPPSAPPPPGQRGSAPPPPWQQLPAVSVTPAYAPVASSQQRSRASSTSQSAHLRARTASMSGAEPPRPVGHGRPHSSSVSNGSPPHPRAPVSVYLEASLKRKRAEDDAMNAAQVKRQQMAHASTPSSSSGPAATHRPPSSHSQTVVIPPPPPPNAAFPSPTTVKRKRVEDDVPHDSAKRMNTAQPSSAAPGTPAPAPSPARNPASVSPSIANMLAPEDRQSPRALYVPAMPSSNVRSPVPPPSVTRSPSTQHRVSVGAEWKPPSFTSPQLR